MCSSDLFPSHDTWRVSYVLLLWSELYQEYKANRKEKYENQSEAEKEAAAKFFEGLDECYKRLEEEFTLLRFKNVEADDLMAYTVKKFEESDKYDKIWIISTDRDMCQMLSYTTSQFAYTSDIFLNSSKSFITLELKNSSSSRFGS